MGIFSLKNILLSGGVAPHGYSWLAFGLNGPPGSSPDQGNCILGQDTLVFHCLSPPKSISGYRREYSWSLHATETGISAGRMNYLAQSYAAYLIFTVQTYIKKAVLLAFDEVSTSVV